MKNLITTDVKMTSLDIANVVEKEHYNIMRDIRNEIKVLGDEVGQFIFEESTYINSQNKEQPCYEFGKDGAMQLALKYDAKTRYNVIQYIKQLEENLNKPSYMIDDPVKRAEKWIGEQKEKQLLEQENEVLKPKATYHDLVLQSETLLSTTQVAKDLGLGAPTLNKKLNELGVQYKKGHRWYLYHEHQDKGYTQSKTHVISADESKDHMYWTQEGKKFIFKLLEEKENILPVIRMEEWCIVIKISNITYHDVPINIIGLNELLADVDLWKEQTDEESNYTRTVYKEDGRTITLLRRNKHWLETVFNFILKMLTQLG